MTNICYPDLRADSRDRRFSLTARSPDNETPGFHAFQREFVYSLVESPADRVVCWTRLQPRGEESPGDLAVSDSGVSVIRLHGFRPQLVAFDAQGEELLRVQISGELVR